jgi:dTDP-4-dehydrorhamnose reductase
MIQTDLRPVVVLGANGQLGSDLCKEYASQERELVPLTRADVDVCDHDRVAHVLETLRPTTIINNTAFHRVEACEAKPADAFAVNSLAVRNLAVLANRLGSALVHLSTDYVFDGEQRDPYSERACPNPLNVYGVSKVAGESFLRQLCPRHLLIRTSGLFGLAGSSGKGGNFVETMLRLGSERGVVSVVADQIFSPTYTLDLARMIWRLEERRAQGLFHVTNGGSCSWSEFAQYIFDQASVPAEVRPVNTSSTTPSVKRPHYSVLDNKRLQADGFGLLRSWRDALDSYLKARSDTKAQAGVPAWGTDQRTTARSEDRSREEGIRKR